MNITSVQFCGSIHNYEKPVPKRTDCIFYSEIQDMHALIPQCKLCSEFAECSCKPDCESYAPNAMALKARAAVKAKNKRSIWVWKPAADAGNPLPLIIMAREASKKFPHHMERIKKLNG